MTDINERGGQLPATPSGNSPGWLQKTQNQLTRTCSAGDIVRQFARLTAAYGDSRVATAEQRALLVREWQEAFTHHAPDHLHDAVSMTIKGCKFWPTIAEVNEQLTHIRREAIAAVDVATGRTRFKAETEGFARDGRSDVEEMAHRAAQVLRWKQEYGFGQSKDPLESPRVVREASQDMSVSDALMATAVIQRIREREGVS